MAANLETVVKTTVDALGYDLVDIALAPRGLLRVFIDRRGAESGQVTVEDCALISNQLSRVFLVESLEYERLEVSSPGLDRPLKTEADFRRYVGAMVKVRLFQMTEDRKRFEGVVESVVGSTVRFALRDADAKNKGRAKYKSPASKAVLPDADVATTILSVSIENIEKARLVPDI